MGIELVDFLDLLSVDLKVGCHLPPFLFFFFFFLVYFKRFLDVFLKFVFGCAVCSLFHLVVTNRGSSLVAVFGLLILISLLQNTISVVVDCGP